MKKDVSEYGIVTKDQGLLVVSITNKKVKGKTKFQIEIQPQPDSLRIPLIQAVDVEQYLILVSSSHEIHVFNRDTKSIIEKLQGHYDSAFLNGDTAFLRSNNGDIFYIADGMKIKTIITGTQGRSLYVHNSQLVVLAEGGALKSFPLQ